MIIFTLSVWFEVLRKISDDRDDVNSILEAMSSFALSLATISIMICFKIYMKKIPNLVLELKKLGTYFVPLDISKMESRMRFLTNTAIFFTYCTSLLYGFLPLVQYNKCQIEKNLRTILSIFRVEFLHQCCYRLNTTKLH